MDLYGLLGQKISLQKPNIAFSKGVDIEVAKEISNMAWIPITSDQGRYLGTPSIDGRVGQIHFQQVVERICSRLESWKTKFLFMAGRHTLAM